MYSQALGGHVIVHTLPFVTRVMLQQVMRDYSGIPDYRTMSFSDIAWLYDGLRGELKSAYQTAQKLKANRRK